MNSETKTQVIICLKTAWLVATAAILFMGTAVCTSSDKACVPAGTTMLIAMFVLTFPTGALFFLLATIFVDPGHVLEPADFIVAWILMLIAGLIQWFLIVPSFNDDGAPLSLNLNHCTIFAADTRRADETSATGDRSHFNSRRCDW